MHPHERLNYVEYPARDMQATKQFFETVFGWTFTDFGPEYSAFSSADAGLDGGFYQADARSRVADGGALMVFYSENLESTLQKITQAGGKVVVSVFDFPGGRRFHFTEPSGNEMAVWSDQRPHED